MSAARNSVEKIGPKVHMQIISINSMRKSKKIPGRRLSIVPSSCALVSCWFWIVMLHRSLGVLAATPLQVLIVCVKDPICTNLSTRSVIQFFTDSWPFPTFEFNFDRWKHMQLGILSACQTSPWHKAFVMFFCYCLGYFCRWHFFLHFHLRLVWRRKTMEDLVLLWRIHRGGRAWLGTSWASNGKWYHSCRFVSPLHSQFFFRK